MRICNCRERQVWVVPRVDCEGTLHRFAEVYYDNLVGLFARPSFERFENSILPYTSIISAQQALSSRRFLIHPREHVQSALFNLQTPTTLIPFHRHPALGPRRGLKYPRNPLFLRRPHTEPLFLCRPRPSFSKLAPPWAN